MANVALLATIADAKASQATQTVSPVMPTGVILPYGGNTAPAGWLVCDGAEYSQTTYADLFAALGSTYNTQLNPVTGVNWAAPSGGNFRVPDMRGMFMRGEGTPSGLDAVSVGGSQVQKTKPNGLTNANSSLSALSVTLSAVGGSDGTHTHTASSSSSSSSSHNSPTHAHDHGNATGGWAAGVAKSGTYGAAYFVAGSWSDRYPDVRTDGLVYGNGLGLTVSTTTTTTTTTATTNSGHGHGAPTLSTLNSSTVTAQTISGDNETRPINRGVKYIIKV